jgi:surface protein
MKLKLASYLLMSSTLLLPSAASSAGASESVESIETLLSIPEGASSLPLSLEFLLADADDAKHDVDRGEHASKTAKSKRASKTAKSVIATTSTPSSQPSKFCFPDRATLKAAVDGLPGSEEQYGPIGTWCTKLITDMSDLFLNTAFNSDINSWDVSQVTTMDNMFKLASAYNMPLDKWDVSNVESMFNMYISTSSFNQDISSWNVSSVVDFGYMFNNAQGFSQDLCAWGPKMQFGAANFNVQAMFQNSGCANKNNPVGPSGPLCVLCL